MVNSLVKNKKAAMKCCDETIYCGETTCRDETTCCDETTSAMK
jgi:hypothetical protein